MQVFVFMGRGLYDSYVLHLLRACMLLLPQVMQMAASLKCSLYNLSVLSHSTSLSEVHLISADVHEYIVDRAKRGMKSSLSWLARRLLLVVIAGCWWWCRYILA